MYKSQMKKGSYAILSFLFMLLLVSSCKSNATIGIPSQQEFVLGEYSGRSFRVELRNLSDETVDVKTIDKTSGETQQQFGLSPKGKTSLYVSRSENVILSNPSAVDVNVKAVLNKTVEGMRYQDIKN